MISIGKTVRCCHGDDALHALPLFPSLHANWRSGAVAPRRALCCCIVPTVTTSVCAIRQLRMTHTVMPRQYPLAL